MIGFLQGFWEFILAIPSMIAAFNSILGFFKQRKQEARQKAIDDLKNAKTDTEKEDALKRITDNS